MAYSHGLYTVVETQAFIRTAAKIWDVEEREQFISWLANNPDAGNVISGSGGLRKVRWSRQGMGKRGGARAIYYNVLDDGMIWLVVAYAKAEYDNLPTHVLNQLREAVENGNR